jgi:hypothetical protein
MHEEKMLQKKCKAVSAGKKMLGKKQKKTQWFKISMQYKITIIHINIVTIFFKKIHRMDSIVVN